MRRTLALLGLAVLTTACAGGESCPGGGILEGDFCSWDHHDWCTETQSDQYGDPQLRVVRAYDDEGRIAKETVFATVFDGSASNWIQTSSTTVSYDGDVTTRRMDTDADGGADMVYRFTYEDGLLVLIEGDDGADGSWDYLESYTYDDLGRTTSITYDYAFDDWDSAETWTWTGDPEDGVEALSWESTSADTERREYEWERDNGVLLVDRYDLGGDGWDTVGTYEMKARGVPDTAVVTYGDNASTYSWFYAAERLARVLAEGSNVHDTTYTRDDQGRLLERKRVSNDAVSEHVTYTYDCLD